MIPATAASVNSTPAERKPTSRNPWLWVPSLYFSEGIPYVIVMTMSVVMYKRLGISNTDIALCTKATSRPPQGYPKATWERMKKEERRMKNG